MTRTFINDEDYLVENDTTYLNNKIKFIQWFGGIGAVFLFIYSIINLYIHDYWAFILELVLSLVLAIEVIIINKRRKLYPTVNLGLIAGILIVWQNYFSGGFADTGILWAYLSPLVSFFLVGAKRALKWNALLYSGLFAIQILSLMNILPLRYDTFMLIMLFITLGINSFIIYIYQSNIENYNLRELVSVSKIRELNQLREKFITMAAHQFRTPLSVIRWNTETLLEKKFDNETRQNIETTYKSALEVINRLDTMLTAISIKEGKIETKLEKANPIEIIKQQILSLQKAFPKKQVHIQQTVSQTTGVKFKTDIAKFSYIVNSVLDNAFHYTDEAGNIDINIDATANALVLTVADDGIGISADEQKVIFELFARGHNATLSNPNASGASLYIADYFAKLLNATIQVESKLAKGSKFTIIFNQE
jgi:signal transduction histidine kinase